jgi:hypothetical protein
VTITSELTEGSKTKDNAEIGSWSLQVHNLTILILVRTLTRGRYAAPHHAKHALDFRIW